MTEELLTIRRAEIDDINEIGFLANQIWPKVYDYMISADQISYMIGLYYSPEALYRQMTEQHHVFLLAEIGENPVGFASFSRLEPGVFNLHKLYLQPDLQGKGIGKALVEAVLDEAFEGEGRYLRLKVNRTNKSIPFYQKLGFKIIGEEDIDIGSGYYMNDYIMQRDI